MISSLQDEHKYIINLLKDICSQNNSKIYIVGGAVRDYLIGAGSKDIDICSEKDILPILEKLVFKDKEVIYKYYDKFQTSTIFYKDISIDFIRCRSEVYQYYGALPEISPSNLYQDLKRRDFTVNAVAYDIIDDSYVDYFDGVKDLKNKAIKKIHENSYNEDATRILRAVKYANRLGFSILDENEIEDAVSDGIMNSISNDRFIKEVCSIIIEKNWIKNIEDLDSFKIIKIEEKCLKENYYFIKDTCFEDRLIRLFLSFQNDCERELFINNSIIDKKIKKSLKKYYNHKDEIYSKLEGNVTNFQIYDVLRQLDDLTLKLLSSDGKLFFKIYNYNMNLKNLYNAGIVKEYQRTKFYSTGKSDKEIGSLLKKYNKLRLNLLSEIKCDDFLKIEET